MPKLIGKLYWVLGMERWVSLDDGIPSLAPGTPLSLLMGWNNDGLETVQGRVRLNIVRPDGTLVALAAVANQDKAAQPSNGWLVQFAPVALDQIGSYRAEATLEVQPVATGLWDGVLWLVNVDDRITDWGLRFSFFSEFELLGYEDKHVGWWGPSAPMQIPAPYTWMSLGSIAAPQNVTRIRITAVDTGSAGPDYWQPSSPIFLMFFKPPGRSTDPAQQGLNMTGRVYISESGLFDVFLGQTL